MTQPDTTIQSLLAQAARARQAGRWDEAERLYRQALQTAPNDPDPCFLLGTLFHEAGRLPEAATLMQRACQLQPDNPDFHYHLATVFKGLGRLNEAGKALQRALRHRPQFAEAYNDLGVVCKALNRIADAIRCYHHALRAKPGYADAWYNLGIAQHAAGQLDDAMESYRQALRLDPQDSQALTNLGNVHRELEQYEEAIRLYKEAIRLSPTLTEAYFNLANALRAQGKLEEAYTVYRKTLQCDRDRRYPEAYYALSKLKRFTEGDPDIEAMQSLLDSGRLNQEQEYLFNFALGKAHEDLKEYDLSFSYLEKGNRLKRATFDYRIEEDLEEMCAIEQTFSAGFFADRSHCGDPEARPIFILGMPRSGTTLVEQILASHPRVQGAGELRDLRLSLFTTLPRFDLTNFPHAAKDLDEQDIRQLAADYMARTRRFREKEDDLVTDKMPVNFLYIGMIRLLFPGARIIHCRRDPVDTCLSCYKHCFTGIQRFAYDLGELGQYYRGYQRLMAHWHEVLPGFIHDVQYEDLVADQESQTRRLLEYCGLPWHENCLNFHKTRRTVKTASDTQVRRPLYRNAVRHWKHYEKHLGPLLQALDQETR